MKSFFLITFVLFILNGSVSSQTFSTYTQIISNPVNISSFKFNAKIKEGYELEGFDYASSSRYPYVCKLQINKNSSGVLCTGSLIRDNWVLTSRACVDGATQILVTCGSESRGKNYSVKVFSSKQQWPTVTAGDYVNIVLVKLDNAVTFNKYINTVRIPTVQFGSKSYASINITALNRFQSSRSSFYGTLQSLNLRVIPDTSCLVSYSFCSEVTKPEQDFSAGYLGGPAVFKDSDGNDTLIGINYESIRNAYYADLQVSMKISNFVNWINQVLNVITDRMRPEMA